MQFVKEDFSASPEFKAIHEMYNNYFENIRLIDEKLGLEGNVSLASEYKQLYIKIFLVASANSFERCFLRVIPEILGFNNDSIHAEFVKNQALTRKYHTLFSWDKNNANAFFSLFGKKFKEHIENYRKSGVKFSDYEKAFLLLGKYRNAIVHDGITLYSVEMSLDAGYQLFEDSIQFCIDTFEQLYNFHSEVTSEFGK